MHDLAVPVIVYTAVALSYEFLCLSPKNLIFCLLFRTLHPTEVKDSLRVIRLHLEKLFDPCMHFLLLHLENITFCIVFVLKTGTVAE